MYGWTHRQTYRKTDTKTPRQTDRQTDRVITVRHLLSKQGPIIIYENYITIYILCFSVAVKLTSLRKMAVCRSNKYTDNSPKKNQDKL